MLENQRTGVCLVTCPICGHSYNSKELLHFCQNIAAPAMLASEVESLKRRVEKLEGMLKRNGNFSEKTAWPCTAWPCSEVSEGDTYF
jgi:hypothetical protein